MLNARQARGSSTHISSFVSALAFMGMNTVAVVPLPVVLSNDGEPPCASTKRLEIGKPKPMPLALVVKSGVQILFNVSFDIPLPVSEKVNLTLSLTFVLFIVNDSPSGIASTAFLIKLTKTRFIFSASTAISLSQHTTGPQRC